jgi:hypothetical protein
LDYSTLYYADFLRLIKSKRAITGMKQPSSHILKNACICKYEQYKKLLIVRVITSLLIMETSLIPIQSYEEDATNNKSTKTHQILNKTFKKMQVHKIKPKVECG